MFLAFWIQCCFSGSCCGQDLQLQVLSCSACVFVVVTPIWQKSQDAQHPAAQNIIENYVAISDLVPLQDTEIARAPDAVCPSWKLTLNGFARVTARKIKAKMMYRIIATVSDNTGSIAAVIFNRAGKQLLGKTCEELASTEDPVKTLCPVIGKEAVMCIQLHYDRRTRTMKCVVN
ncbi:putative nucleic acid-binding protein [Helianthus annuus]|nr:putative nucleic acid-binding protein [Helianthus annuus]KAJ0446505.1 putative nucleic acid-binding protein [Helianthus annuus]KAJ0635325.1 putative nucleic acid-binding protein [Helianthus annuus]KAJ0782902.1 putative nucleic acid-binding protein [Helianthus annuus]KAJ0825114.1 putative nucleic acid-binding protein [Helianthus annuus]